MGEALITRRGGGGGGVLSAAVVGSQGGKTYRITDPRFPNWVSLNAGDSKRTIWTFKGNTSVSDELSCACIYINFYVSTYVATDARVILTPNEPVSVKPPMGGYNCTYELTLKKDSSGYWVIEVLVTNDTGSSAKYTTTTNIEDYTLFFK